MCSEQSLQSRKYLFITTDKGYKICKSFYTCKIIKTGINQTECQKNNLQFPAVKPKSWQSK